MQRARGYFWGSAFFALIVVVALGCLPYALSCCSRFSDEDLALRRSLGSTEWAPGITPVAVALLDWPMGFRLLLLTIVAAGICLACTVTGLLVVRKLRDDVGAGGSIYAWSGVLEAVLGSLMVGVLYLFSLYATGYVGYVGPRNALWFFGIPLFIASVQQARLSRALAWTFPLLLGGWLCTAILSMTVGIPLD